MRTIRTPKKRSKFIESLRETGGNVTLSCELSDISKRAVYDWRAVDSNFAAAWDEAVEAGTEDLESEARRRALIGVEEPVYYQGDICGTVRKYSDTLLIFLLKGRRPDKYRENVKQEIVGTVEHTHKVVRVPPKVTKEEWPEILEVKL